MSREWSAFMYKSLESVAMRAWVCFHGVVNVSVGRGVLVVLELPCVCLI